MTKTKFLYVVQKREGDHYNINKVRKDDPKKILDSYGLTIKRKKDGTWDLWCDCMGFRRQNYPKIEHKHVRIIIDYLERGQPEWAEYSIRDLPKGKASRHSIRCVRVSLV